MKSHILDKNQANYNNMMNFTKKHCLLILVPAGILVSSSALLEHPEMPSNNDGGSRCPMDGCVASRNGICRGYAGIDCSFPYEICPDRRTQCFGTLAACSNPRTTAMLTTGTNSITTTAAAPSGSSSSSTTTIIEEEEEESMDDDHQIENRSTNDMVVRKKSEHKLDHPINNRGHFTGSEAGGFNNIRGVDGATTAKATTLEELYNVDAGNKHEDASRIQPYRCVCIIHVSSSPASSSSSSVTTTNRIRATQIQDCMNRDTEVCEEGQSVSTYAFCTNGGRCVAHVPTGRPHPGCRCAENFEGQFCQYRSSTTGITSWYDDEDGDGTDIASVPTNYLQNEDHHGIEQSIQRHLWLLVALFLILTMIIVLILLYEWYTGLYYRPCRGSGSGGAHGTDSSSCTPRRRRTIGIIQDVSLEEIRDDTNNHNHNLAVYAVDFS